MQLSCDPFDCKTAPEWLITNGRVTVGPVGTELLLRGVRAGRVPSDALVREVDWPHWRGLGQIREVCALTRVLEHAGESSTRLGLRQAIVDLRGASDVAEALAFALRSAAQATSATVGLAHRLRGPLFLPTTSCVYEVSSDLLGEVLPWFDPAFELARLGGLVLGPVGAGVVERAIARRLSSEGELRGVAMLPVTVRGRLLAMLELGRRDHAFRASDATELADFASQVGRALAELTGAALRQ